MFNFVIILLSAVIIAFSQPVFYWIEATQEDFKDGVYERNIYASHRLGGAIEFVPSFDLNNDGYIDLFVAGYPPGNPNYIYWGGINGYSINRRTSYPGNCGGNCDAADLNCDGYPDFLSCRYHSWDIWIHWGHEGGPDPNDTTVLHLDCTVNETSLIADFNKDGYLDIAVGNYDTCLAAIFWGSSSGYSSLNTTKLPVNYETGYNLETADFNKDNWLDLLIVNMDSSSNFIYWGSIDGFSANNCSEVPFLSEIPHGASVADLNNDGWLDLVLTGYNNIEKSYIYWGSPNGFQTHQVLNLRYPAYGGSSISDLNGDEYLDILFILGNHGYNVTQKPRIYWGSENGYSNTNYTKIGFSINGSGGFIADLNYDGNLDVYINNYYGSNSPVFWGPAFNSYQEIDHIGIENHHAMAREVGNTYNRKYYEDYQSSVFDAGFVVYWGKIAWQGYLPSGTEIRMFVRSGNTPNPDSTWTSWFEVINRGFVPASLDARYLQYMAKLIYTNPSYLPMLDSIIIEYSQVPAIRIDDPTLRNPETAPPIARIDKLCTNDQIPIQIYNCTGRMIGKLSNITQIPVFQAITWDITDFLGKKLPAGVYFYRLPTGDGIFETRKLVILK